MGIGDAIGPVVAPAGKMFGGGLARAMSYAWVIFPVIIVLVIIGMVFIVKNIKAKKTQWTHKLKVRRVLPGGLLSDPVYMKMRRFPLIKKAEVFELEKPLLGGYLIPELDQYSGINEFSIILDNNNRIYTNTGEYFSPDKNSVNVSAKHAEIDIQRSNLKADFQNINKINKRIEWATIAKYAFMLVFVVAVMIVIIMGLSKWGAAQDAKAEVAKAEAMAMESLSSAMDVIAATVNTQKLEILPMMKEIYKTKNLQGIINLSPPDEDS